MIIYNTKINKNSSGGARPRKHPCQNRGIIGDYNLCVTKMSVRSWILLVVGGLLIAWISAHVYLASNAIRRYCSSIGPAWSMWIPYQLVCGGSQWGSGAFVGLLWVSAQSFATTYHLFEVLVDIFLSTVGTVNKQKMSVRKLFRFVWLSKSLWSFTGSQWWEQIWDSL